MIIPGIDHIALNVPDLGAQIERLTADFGLVLEHRIGHFALLTDPATGIKVELGQSEDDDVQFRHFGFRAENLDSAHQHLADTGMGTTEEPHRREFAGMYTSFLHQQGCAEIQLVTYDPPEATVPRAGPSRQAATMSTGKRG